MSSAAVAPSYSSSGSQFSPSSSQPSPPASRHPPAAPMFPSSRPAKRQKTLRQQTRMPLPPLMRNAARKGNGAGKPAMREIIIITDDDEDVVVRAESSNGVRPGQPVNTYSGDSDRVGGSVKPKKPMEGAPKKIEDGARNSVPKPPDIKKDAEPGSAQKPVELEETDDTDAPARGRRRYRFGEGPSRARGGEAGHKSTSITDGDSATPRLGQNTSPSGPSSGGKDVYIPKEGLHGSTKGQDDSKRDRNKDQNIFTKMMSSRVTLKSTSRREHTKATPTKSKANAAFSSPRPSPLSSPFPSSSDTTKHSSSSSGQRTRLRIPLPPPPLVQSHSRVNHLRPLRTKMPVSSAPPVGPPPGGLERNSKGKEKRVRATSDEPGKEPKRHFGDAAAEAMAEGAEEFSSINEIAPSNDPEVAARQALVNKEKSDATENFLVRASNWPEDEIKDPCKPWPESNADAFIAMGNDKVQIDMTGTDFLGPGNAFDSAMHNIPPEEPLEFQWVTCNPVMRKSKAHEWDTIPPPYPPSAVEAKKALALQDATPDVNKDSWEGAEGSMAKLASRNDDSSALPTLSLLDHWYNTLLGLIQVCYTQAEVWRLMSERPGHLELSERRAKMCLIGWLADFWLINGHSLDDCGLNDRTIDYINSECVKPFNTYALNPDTEEPNVQEARPRKRVTQADRFAMEMGMSKWKGNSRFGGYQRRGQKFRSEIDLRMEWIEQAKPVRALLDGAFDVSDIVWDGNGQRFAVSTAIQEDYGRPGSLWIGDHTTDSIVCLPAHREVIDDVRIEGNKTYLYKTTSRCAFSNDSRFLYSAGYDGKIALWDAKTCDLVSEYAFTEESIYDKEIPGPLNVRTMEKARLHDNVLACGTNEGLLHLLRHDEYGVLERTAVPYQAKPFARVRADGYAPSCIEFGNSYCPNWIFVGYETQSQNGKTQYGDLKVLDLATLGKARDITPISEAYFCITTRDNILATAGIVRERTTVVESEADAQKNAKADPKTNGKKAGPKQQKDKKKSEKKDEKDDDPEKRHPSAIRLYDVRKTGWLKPEIQIRSPEQHDVNKLTFSPCGNYITSSSQENFTRMWDLRKPLLHIATYRHGRHREPVNGFGETRKVLVGVQMCEWVSSERLWTGGHDTVVKAWDPRVAEDDALVKNVFEADGQIMVGAFAHNHTELLVGDSAGHAWLLNASGTKNSRQEFTVTDWSRVRETSMQETQTGEVDEPEFEGRDAAAELVRSGKMFITPDYFKPGIGKAEPVSASSSSDNDGSSDDDQSHKPKAKPTRPAPRTQNRGGPSVPAGRRIGLAAPTPRTTLRAQYNEPFEDDDDHSDCDAGHDDSDDEDSSDDEQSPEPAVRPSRPLPRSQNRGGRTASAGTISNPIVNKEPQPYVPNSDDDELYSAPPPSRRRGGGTVSAGRGGSLAAALSRATNPAHNGTISKPTTNEEPQPYVANSDDDELYAPPPPPRRLGPVTRSSSRSTASRTMSVRATAADEAPMPEPMVISDADDGDFVDPSSSNRRAAPPPRKRTRTVPARSLTNTRAPRARARAVTYYGPPSLTTTLRFSTPGILRQFDFSSNVFVRFVDTPPVETSSPACANPGIDNGSPAAIQAAPMPETSTVDEEMPDAEDTQPELVPESVDADPPGQSARQRSNQRLPIPPILNQPRRHPSSTRHATDSSAVASSSNAVPVAPSASTERTATPASVAPLSNAMLSPDMILQIQAMIDGTRAGLASPQSPSRIRIPGTNFALVQLSPSPPNGPSSPTPTPRAPRRINVKNLRENRRPAADGATSSTASNASPGPSSFATASPTPASPAPSSPATTPPAADTADVATEATRQSITALLGPDSDEEEYQLNRMQLPPSIRHWQNIDDDEASSDEEAANSTRPRTEEPSSPPPAATFPTSSNGLRLLGPAKKKAEAAAAANAATPWTAAPVAVPMAIPATTTTGTAGSLATAWHAINAHFIPTPAPAPMPVIRRESSGTSADPIDLSDDEGEDEDKWKDIIGIDEDGNEYLIMDKDLGEDWFAEDNDDRFYTPG